MARGISQALPRVLLEQQIPSDEDAHGWSEQSHGTHLSLSTQRVAFLLAVSRRDIEVSSTLS
jgi:hypothetical protein